MEISSIQQKYMASEKWYVRISLWMLGISLGLLGISAILVRSVIAAPIAVIHLTTIYLYSHLVHFFYGVFRWLRFVFSSRKRVPGLRIGRTIFSIFLSPVSAFIAYIALILLALSSCAS